jgi:hypothetical protein
MEVGRVGLVLGGESCGPEYRDGEVGPELPDRSMFRRKPLSIDGGWRSDMTIRGITNYQLQGTANFGTAITRSVCSETLMNVINLCAQF